MENMESKPTSKPAPSAEDILREFMGDVEAVGKLQVAIEWPDLIVTYNKAKSYFRQRSK